MVSFGIAEMLCQIALLIPFSLVLLCWVITG